MSLFSSPEGGTGRLRSLCDAGPIVQVPGCFDALSVRVLERSGHSAAFLGGFSVAAARLGLPDVGLLSYGEMIDQARNVCAATSLPVIGDADTGYGNAINAERALLGCAQAGLACMMIEDQCWPKRCGHTAGKEIVDRDEALRRIRACVRAREEYALDILIMARTDANATDGFEEALWRAEAFADAGADFTFLEAPENAEQMEAYCQRIPGWKVANLVEDGRTPWHEAAQLEEMGYSLVLYPVSLLLHCIEAMQGAAEQLKRTGQDGATRATFDQARSLVGWPEYEERLRGLEESESSTHPSKTKETKE
jgi:2-methylisocitrate lyase-like PEP mutase family enzyme